MSRLFMVATLLAAVATCHASHESDSTQTHYPQDGVYNSFSAFRNGKPDLVRDRMIRSLNDSLFTIRQWVNSENLYYVDGKGEKASYDPFTFWGFVERGVLYLYLGGKFHKVHTLGSISYFLESYPVIKGNMAPVVTESRATSSYRFLDMETGDILDYTPENLLQLLERDEALFLEYKSIVSLKEKKKRMYRFMEEFNKKYPLRRMQN